MKRTALWLLVVGCGGAVESGSLSSATMLSETGLYQDLANGRLARGVEAYEPAFRLWSDGADKQRWILSPDGSPDAASLPIGGRLFKQFGKNGRPIETRVISREGEEEFSFGTFLWRADLSDADRIEEGVQNADGAGHDVPSTGACTLCHGSSPSKTLGWSPLQLAAEIDRDDPISEGLGYLHANCGHCHGDGGIAMASVDMVLRLELVDGRIDATRVLASTVDREATTGVGRARRIAPGDPEQSAIIYRMTQLDGDRMPPLGTHAIDEQGVLQVSRMIEALAHQ
jgi:hypothetical protein